jgi:hypothetical protein
VVVIVRRGSGKGVNRKVGVGNREWRVVNRNKQEGEKSDKERKESDRKESDRKDKERDKESKEGK